MVLTVEEGPPSAGARLEDRASEIRWLKPPAFVGSVVVDLVGVAAEAFAAGRRTRSEGAYASGLRNGSR